MKKLYLIIFLSTTFESCETIQKIAFGMHSPDYESHEALEKYLDKHSLKLGDIVWVSPTAYKLFVNSPFKPTWPNGFRPDQIQTFDSTGDLIMKWATCEGFIDSVEILETFPPKNYKKWNQIFPAKLNDELKNFLKADGTHPEINASEYDIVMLVFWGKCLGKVSRITLSHVKKYIDTYPQKRIKVLLVSTDLVKELEYNF